MLNLFDRDLDGRLDSLVVTFSESFTETGANSPIDASDFSISGYNITNVDVSAAPSIYLRIDSVGANNDPDTYVVPDVQVVNADILRDAAGAGNPIQTFTNTQDKAAPYITVTTQSSNNLFPDFFWCC